MKHPIIILATALTISAVSSYAHAGSRKTVQVWLKNDSYDQKMRCHLDALIKRGSVTETKQLDSWVVAGRKNLSEDARLRPRKFKVDVAPVAKTLAGKYTYPGLQLTCKLDGNNHARNEVESSVWEHEEDSFNRHHLFALCNHGQPCSAFVEPD